LGSYRVVTSIFEATTRQTGVVFISVTLRIIDVFSVQNNPHRRWLYAMTQPYSNEGLVEIYQLLFSDDIERYRRSYSGSLIYPWRELFDEATSDEALRQILDDSSLETRPKLLAANTLTKRGGSLPTRRLLGVVIEVGLDQGLDVLAAYQDGTARYINFSGKLIVWETVTPESEALIKDLFTAAETVVAQIGPWDQARRPAPETGQIRLNFLAADGLYFGEGPLAVLARDPLGGPVINAATQLMQFLIGHAQK
jgi:hypothetical protein